MKKLMGLIAAGVALWAVPAAAQNAQQTRSANAPVGGVLTVFGNDPCPDDTICVRAEETERYRIPQDLRNARVRPQQEAWAVRSQDALDPRAVGGIGSCTAVGPGGSTGCFAQEAAASRRENRQRREDQENLPLP